MMKKTFYAMCLFILLSVPVSVYAIGLEAAIGGWSQSPEGDLSYNSLDVLDLENDLKYDDEFRVMARVKIDMPLVIPNIYVTYAPMEFEGEGSKTRDFKFGDETFTASSGKFNSKLTLNTYDICLYYGIPFLNLASLERLNIDIGINVRLMDIKAQIEQGNVSESESITAPIPMIFAAIQIEPIEKFAIEAEIRWVSYDDNQILGFIGRLKVKVFSPAFAAAGYRYDSIAVNESDVDIDTSFSGFFIETGLQF